MIDGGDRTSLIRALAQFLSSDENIRFAFLFGSRARDDYGPNSDIDIGVYYQNEPGLLELGAVISSLQEITGLKADLVELKLLPQKKPEFAHSIAKDAIPIFIREKDKYYEFIANCHIAYFDFAPVLEQSRRLMRERIESGAYGRPLYAAKA